jgi:hypothetical protein
MRVSKSQQSENNDFDLFDVRDGVSLLLFLYFKIKTNTIKWFRALRSVVDRPLRMRKVEGSIPSVSNLFCFCVVCFVWLSPKAKLQLLSFLATHTTLIAMMLVSFLAVLCMCFVHMTQAQLKCTLTSDDCKNKYCLMMESFFSCEVQY